MPFPPGTKVTAAVLRQMDLELTGYVTPEDEERYKALEREERERGVDIKRENPENDDNLRVCVDYTTPHWQNRPY